MTATATLLVTAPVLEPYPADRLKRDRSAKNSDRVSASRTAAADVSSNLKRGVFQSGNSTVSVVAVNLSYRLMLTFL